MPKRLGVLRLPNTLSSLRHPNYRLWFAGQSISLVGTWMQSVAQQWVVYQLTGSKLLLGAVTFANSIPNLFLMLPSGLLADRLPRRRIMLFTQTSMMVLAFIMAGLFISGVLAVWHIFVLAVLLGMINALDAPARQAFTVEMVDDRADLYNAIALNSSMFNLARVIGPALAGFVLAAAGPFWCFNLNGISFLAVIAGLLMMRIPAFLAPKQEQPVRQVLEGLEYTLRHPVILPIMMILAVTTLFALSYSSMLPAFAVDVLNVGEEGLGFLSAAVGVGALAGSLAVASLGHSGRPGQLLKLGSFLFPLSLILFAFSRSYPLSLAALAVTGFGFVAQNASLNTTIQSLVSDELRGRVMSIYLLAFFGFTPFGALLAGALSQWFGPAVGVALNASISLVLSFAIYLAYPAIRQI